MTLTIRSYYLIAQIMSLEDFFPKKDIDEKVKDIVEEKVKIICKKCGDECEAIKDSLSDKFKLCAKCIVNNWAEIKERLNEKT